MAWYQTAEPPLENDALLRNRSLVSCSVPPWNSRPPPGLLLAVGTLKFAWLLASVELDNVRESSVAALPEPAMMPAPPNVPSRPFLIVTFEMVVVTPPTT